MTDGWYRDLKSLTVLFNFEGPVERKLSGDFRAEDRGHPMYGGVAQLGEHLPCTQGVRSSNLLISTRCGLIAQVVRAHA